MYWIKGSSSKWKPFVANRVEEIQSQFSPDHWRYCSGKENPADCLTRGLSCKDLQKAEKWWAGPMASKELTKAVQVLKAVELEEIINPERYGMWTKLIRSTATIFRAVCHFKGLIHQSKQQCQWQDLSVKELKDAEMYWYRKVQSDVYKKEIEALNKKEIEALSKGKRISVSSKLLKLDPFYDSKDNVIRIRGRLQNSNLLEEAKHQIILPHGHPIVEKKIMQVHFQMICAGPSTTLTVLRHNVWITQGLRDVKRVIQNCRRCR